MSFTAGANVIHALTYSFSITRLQRTLPNHSFEVTAHTDTSVALISIQDGSLRRSQGWYSIWSVDLNASLRASKVKEKMARSEGAGDVGVRELTGIISFLAQLQEEGHDRPLDIPETLQSWRCRRCCRQRSSTEGHGMWENAEHISGCEEPTNMFSQSPTRSTTARPA